MADGLSGNREEQERPRQLLNFRKESQEKTIQQGQISGKTQLGEFCNETLGNV
jgi:hypothetical protein